MKRILPVLAIILSTVTGSFAQTPRVCLYEEFTGENCPPCAAANPALNLLLKSPANAPKVIALKWEVPIPSAPTKTWSLYQTNKNEINWRYSAYGYGVNSAPQGRMDGQDVTVFGAASNHPTDLNDNVIATAQSYTSPFSITMLRDWNNSTTAVNLTITVQASANFTSVGNLVFRTVMVERVIQFNDAPGTNGEKKFEDVAVRSFPSIQAGTALQKSWTNGQSHTFTLSCPVPAYIRSKQQIAMVGFIQDDGNKKVVQAARTNTAAVPAEALSQVGAKTALTCNGIITPEVTIKNEGVSAITSLTIVPYNDNVAGNVTTWTGNLAPSAITTITLNSISTPTLTGGHTFSYDVLLNVPYYDLRSDKKTSTYMVASAVLGASVAEGFTTNIFPPAYWGVINSNGNAGWSKTFGAGGYNRSSNAAKYDFYSNSVIGDVDELYLPPMDLASAGTPVLEFDMAYATRNGRNDKLEILVSDDCGQNWSKVFSDGGANLSTVPFEVNTGAYSPDPFDTTHWMTRKINLTGFNKPAVLVKFVTTSDNGNNLYLDNINLAKWQDVGLKEQGLGLMTTVYPNPASGEVTLRVESATREKAKLLLLNMMGQVLYQIDSDLNAGTNEISIGLGSVPQGVYSLQLITERSVSSSKINIVH